MTTFGRAASVTPPSTRFLLRLRRVEGGVSRVARAETTPPPVALVAATAAESDPTP